MEYTIKAVVKEESGYFVVYLYATPQYINTEVLHYKYKEIADDIAERINKYN